MTDQPYTQDERLAIEMFFAGDEAFFSTYRDSCRQQFQLDIAQGDQALMQADWATLKRVAHSIKGVLKSLGQPELAEQAANIEKNIEDNPQQDWATPWRQLCADIGSTFQFSLVDGQS